MITEPIEDYLSHYGILRKSGRYPWGSGGTETQRSRDFLDMASNLKKKGLTDTEIAKAFDLTTIQLRETRTISNNVQKQEKINQAQKLQDKGYSTSAIGRRMGLNESSVRDLLKPGAADKLNTLSQTADMLRRQVDQKKYIDIGRGVELSLPIGSDPATTVGISKEKFKTAVAVLKDEGYTIHYIKVRQIATGQDTSRIILAKPGVPYKEVYANRDHIRLIDERTDDYGRTYRTPYPPINISSKRIQVRYAEDGGKAEDGVIYIRPGVKNLSLGKSHYAQVRIAVDGTHYIKGMAIYKDDLPPHVDLVVNTNKSKTDKSGKAVTKKDIFKPFEKDVEGNIDPLNPFGAEIRDQRGALNILHEEGQWDTWSRTLSAQFLSKQNLALAKTQLNMTHEQRKMELAEIKKLTNPVVRKKMLESFADSTDSAAVHLHAAALPRQTNKVILPLTSIKPHEVYAPTFKHGERVVLIRYPHAGTFEIPQLTVNNRNKEGRKLIGTGEGRSDAIGIHHKVAEHLSGADFDGDTIVIIPNNRGTVKHAAVLEGLKNFDPQSAYPGYPGMKPMGKVQKENEMGRVTNLIADMSLKGANTEEMARAVRHSMVVIDSEKHTLDFKGSEKANGIAQLRAKYQAKEGRGKGGGASTLITLASSEKRVPEQRLRKASEGGPVDPATGKLVFVRTGVTYPSKKTGAPVTRKTVTTHLADTHDAHTLSSGLPMEKVYAEHSNKLKAMANDARKEALHTKLGTTDPVATKAHAPEVASLNAKLNIAKKNAPRERQAQQIANAIVAQKRQANPNLEAEKVKKIKNQALLTARERIGAGKQRIHITDQEWAAIQDRAISKSKLTEILNNADLEQVRKLATPRTSLLMTSTKVARAKSMAASGYTQDEIATALGVSLTTLKTSINE